MHRDTERQRRQEMSKLYTCLRTLLPHEHIKGKRSIGDHMHEAVNYIKHMDMKLNEMRMRRDELKKRAGSSIYSQNKISNGAVNPQNCIIIKPCLDGLEILIAIGLKGEETHSLSKILKLLTETAIDVISCISTKSSERLLHRIQCTGNGVAHINLPVLEERLGHVINSD